MSALKPVHLYFLITALAFSACGKTDVPAGTPSCIKKKIRQINNDPVRNPPAEVWRYDYKGQKVYYIPPYCCDMYGDLYDSKCNLICHPDGGLSGNGDGNCTDFFASRTNGKLIWQDNR